MKIRGLTIAALVLLVLAGFLYWSEHHKPAEESSKISADSPPSILKLDQSLITRLELKKKDAEAVQLSRTGSGDWQITAPTQLRADQGSVSGILSTLSSLNSERLVENKAADLKPFGLDQPSLEVDITQKDKQSKKLLLGDDTPASSGVYAALAGDPRVFTIATYNKTSVDKGVNDLRDKRLLTAAADKISRVQLVRKNEEIEFGRNKDAWQILKPKPLRADNTQVADLVRELTDAKMDISGADAGDAASAFAKAAPIATAKVTDASGTQELQIRKSKDKDKETYYAKSSAFGGAYKVDSSVGKAVDKSLEDFRNKKLFDFGYTDPNKVELHNGTKAYFLTRGTGGSEDWWSNGKKMDADSVDSFLSKLRDLSASKFPDAGLSKPEISLSVVSDDGKRTEKVLITKSGDHYTAQRESEPALYQLDAPSVDDLLKAADEIKPATGSQAMSKKP
jgi:Domain of unknown function (DUF4340)